MPRETVYDSAGQFNIEVGWTKEMENVQVGISLSSDLSIAHWLAGDTEPCSPEEAASEPHVILNGTPLKNVTTTVNGVERKLPTFNSLWGTLDRGQINRLIKALRTARDQAYGKDE